MWTGVIVLIVVVALAVLYLWLAGARPRTPRQRRAGLSIHPGSDPHIH